MTNLIKVKLATDAPYNLSDEMLTEPGLIPQIGDTIELPVPDGTPVIEPVVFLVQSRHFQTRWLDDGKLQIVGVRLFLVEPETVEGCLFRMGRRW